MRFLGLEVSTAPACWNPHLFEVSIDTSFCHMCFTVTTFVPMTQEAYLQYYLDMRRTSAPQFGPPTPASGFSVSSGVKLMSSEVVDSVPGSESRYLRLSCPVPGPMFDGEPATTICSLCAARLDADTSGCEELGRDTHNCFPPSAHRCCLISLCLSS